MFRILITTLIINMIGSSAFSQITLSGPMQGYTTDNSAEIWLMSKRDKGMLDFQVLDKDDAILEMEHVEYKRWNTYKLKVSCDAGETNQLIINEGDRKQSFDFTCGNKVKDDSFSFLLGSCTFKWGPLLPLAPSNGFQIFNAMAKKDSDLMLWLGDNVYYLLGDDRNENRMFKENLKTRRKKALATFLQDKQHYAIWDDHDYGPNNSLGDYKNKELSRNVFDQFWANPPSETEANYYSFEYTNAEFFMLDSRWFRTEPDAKDPALLGEVQLQWLQNGLKKSDADYKFVALGSQIINPKGLKHERFAAYTEEYETLMETAVELDNVIFLSGDMHYSTVFKNEDFGKALYEFTSSPLTAMRYKIRKGNDEHNSPYIMKDMSFHSQNFGKVTVYGDGVTYEIFDRKGRKVSGFKVPRESTEHESTLPAAGDKQGLNDVGH